MNLNSKKEIWLNQGINKFIIYGLVGVLGTAIHLSTLVILVEVFHQDPTVSSSIGFIFTVLISFFLNKNFTFKDANGQTSTMLVKYTLISCFGFLLNSGIMYVTVKLLEIHYFIGQLLVIIILPITNFSLNNYWTFRNKLG